MELVEILQGLFGKAEPSESRTAGGKIGAHPGVGTDKFSGLLGPAALGGIAGALLSGKGVSGLIKGALLGGGGAYLWDKYKDRITAQDATEQKFNDIPAAPRERAERMIRAMVFAAKAGGHIDDKEKTVIMERIGEMNMGSHAQGVVQDALGRPLDPKFVADGVQDAEEALELFTVSCASVDVDHFMAKSYLEALASALGIPEDVKNEVMEKVKTPA